MDVILPVAGFGTRLRPQTWSKPKPLVSLAGKPMLAHVLERVLPFDVSQLVFVTGFLGEQIEEWARAAYDVPQAYVQQPEMKGQCDAIIRTRGVVPDDHDALILFPDMIFEADFAPLKLNDADVVAFTKVVDDPSAYGIAVIEDGRVVQLVEKPQEPVSKLAVIGIYYFKRMGDLYDAIDTQIQRRITLKGEYFLADAIQIMIDEGKVVVPAEVTVWEDCGNGEALLNTNRYLLDAQPPASVAREGSVIIPPSSIDPEAIIERAVVGPYASIGADAVVRDAIVRDAILEDGALVTDAVIEHTILGRKAVVTGKASRLNVGDTSVVQL